MKKLLELKEVSAGYDEDIVLRNVNLSVEERDFIGIIGPNGGGKTTLLKIILGLLKPVKGETRYFEVGVDKMSTIGYLPQSFELDRKFPISVQEVVLSGLMNQKKLYQRYTRKEKELAYSLLDEMGIRNIWKKPLGELSGGQLQRTLLCRAIISSPSLLILDEPSTYVDNKFEGELFEKLKYLNERMAIIVVSHDIGMISCYIKTIACVNRNFHYHTSNIITEKQLAAYDCPIQMITHGDVPHTVLRKHQQKNE
ncbi:MAG: ATP-binding cassette domain-containing protein [Bacteroidales bacterium]|nr:MAG: ATP-binding cassette domain-containing protein [Bacteroidales bacterium]